MLPYRPFPKFLILPFLLFVAFTAQAQNDVTTNPKTGRCYAKCTVPNGYKVVTEQVMVKPESERIITIPAQYETQTEQVMIKEASTKIVPIPAVYQTVTETIEVKPASTKLIKIPATYKMVLERIQKHPAAGWVRSNDTTTDSFGKKSAEYKTIYRKVITPATTEIIEIPAEYATITREVVKTPASYETVEVPAEYRTVTKQVLVSPTSPSPFIPAVYKTVHTLQLIEPEDKSNTKDKPVAYKEEVICDTSIDALLIREVKQSLKNKGYYKGAINGRQGKKINAALEKYQQDKGLPVKYFNLKTLKALGILFD